MGFDRPEADDPEDISGGIRPKRYEQVRQPADRVFAEAEIAEPRTRAEYYQALRAAVDQQTRAIDAGGASADTSPRSAWDSANPLTRPPLDALRVPPERAIHILDGDMTGGGHRHGNRPALACLSAARRPVTATERGELVTLLEAMGMPTGPVEELSAHDA